MILRLIQDAGCDWSRMDRGSQESPCHAIPRQVFPPLPKFHVCTFSEEVGQVALAQKRYCGYFTQRNRDLKTYPQL